MTQGWLQERYPTPGSVFTYQVEEGEGRAVVYLDGEPVEMEVVVGEGNSGWCRVGRRVLPFALAWVGDEVYLWLDGDTFILQRVERQRRSRGGEATVEGDVVAPVPGKVLRVLVEVGQRVEVGQPVVIVESMKMEHVLQALRAGVVRKLSVSEGSPVERGTLLLEMEGDGG